MSVTKCRQCSTALAQGARFCPRCGAKSDAPAPARKRRGEIAVGWALLALAVALTYSVLFGRANWQAWVRFGIGVPVAIIGIGCLAGPSKPAGGTGAK